MISRRWNETAGMDDIGGAGDESAFVNEEVEGIVAKIVHEELNEKVWQEDKIAGWMTSITEKCTEALVELGKPFKYLVTCMIMQDTGAGVCSTPVASFDGVSDGLVAVTWPTEKAKETASLYCIVTVCGMALFSR